MEEQGKIHVSVVITCYNEEENIGGCLKSIMSQDYPVDLYEIIIADGNSKDRTRDIVRDLARDYSGINLLVEQKKGTAAGRNSGVRMAKYDYIAFIDADCIAPNDWLSVLVKNYESAKINYSQVIGVGGRNIPVETEGIFPKAVGIALDSYIGSFSSIQGRQFKQARLVPSISTTNALYEKKKIVYIGYFDESLKSEAEDAEINYRLYCAGNRFLYTPDSFVWHKMCLTPSDWLKNMFRYGKGRARLLKRYPKMWAFAYLLPLFFIILFITTIFMLFSKLPFIWIFYFFALFIFSLFKCTKKKTIILTLQVMLVYFIQHFGYAAGEIYGLVNPNIK